MNSSRAESTTKPSFENEFISAYLLTALFHHSIIFFSIFRKFITGFACVTVGLQSVFFSKFEDVEGFEGKEHIFTHIQKDARDFIDQNIYGIDPQTIRQANAKRLKAAGNSSSNDSSSWILWNESASTFLSLKNQSSVIDVFCSFKWNEPATKPCSDTALG